MFFLFVCFAFVWYSYRLQRHNLVTIGKQWIMCVCFFSCFLCFVTLLFVQCKCLFSFVSLFTFPPSTHECVCVCLYNFAFSHLFYNWGADSRNKKYKENIIFIVKTIHCMCVFVCVSVCSVTKQARFMFRPSSVLLQLLIIHSSHYFFLLDVAREIVNYYLCTVCIWMLPIRTCARDLSRFSFIITFAYFFANFSFLLACRVLS